MQKQWEDTKFQEQVSNGIQKAWEDGKYDHVDWNTYTDKAWYRSSEGRRQTSEALKAAWARGAYDNRGCPSPTGIELELFAALDICSIKHEPQYRPEGYSLVFDEYVPEANLLIEADGDFWHHSEWAAKHGIPERDAKKDTWAKDNGYRLLRISESDIKEFGAWSIVLREVVPLLD